MKKLSLKQKIWMIKKSKAGNSPHFSAPSITFRLDPKDRFSRIVELWDGSEPEQAICIRRPISPPRTLCLRTNASETLGFINGLKLRMRDGYDRGDRDFIKRRPGKKPIINGYADFSQVEFLSTASALMLAAEYDRIRTRLERVPPTINLSDWSDNAFNPLFEIGFFELVGISQDVGASMFTTSSRKTMKIVGMSKNDEPASATVDRYIAELYEFVFPGSSAPHELSIKILTALSEAMSNVFDHAYPIDGEYDVPPINKLWVTAAADADTKSLTIVVYDQGVSIPATYQRMSGTDVLKSSLKDFLNKIGASDLSGHPDDAYIDMAMKFGRSRTDRPNRGKGLPQMSELVTSLGSGKMEVFSGYGRWAKEGNLDVDRGLLDQRLGGTVIVWTVQLSKEA